MREWSVDNCCLSVGLQKATAGYKLEKSENEWNSVSLRVSETTSLVEASTYCPHLPSEHLPLVVGTAVG